jgi:hypothetical protein
MKQHITREQLDELPTAKKKILYEFFFPAEYPADRTLAYVVDINPEFITIGQMIEFLDERVKCLSCMKNQQEGADEWIVSYVNYLHKNKELCDALWEAVKDVLNKNA